MAKEKTLASGSFLSELFQVGVYKRSQGRWTRQLTFTALAVLIAIGVWRLYDLMRFSSEIPEHLSSLQYAVPGVLLAVGLWISYRLVNMPRFADFLIAVEAEMNKVSWPSRMELFRSSLVVIVVIFALAAILFFFDLFWQVILRDLLHILQ